MDEALDELALVLAGEPAAELPTGLPRERASVRRWLAERADGTVLDDDDLLERLERADDRPPSSA